MTIKRKRRPHAARRARRATGAISVAAFVGIGAVIGGQATGATTEVASATDQADRAPTTDPTRSAAVPGDTSTPVVLPPLTTSHGS